MVFITYVLWEENLDNEDPWGVLSIDARNAFNGGNRKLMVWVAHHEWPTGARLLFNMYRHHVILILRGETKKDAKIILSKEGTTQGSPLATTDYGLLVLPMIRQLKVEFSDINSPWFVDDGVVVGKLERVINCFLRLCEI